MCEIVEMKLFYSVRDLRVDNYKISISVHPSFLF